MSTISASTTSTTGFKVTSDTTGTLVFQTGASPTTAMSISSSQIISFTNPPTATGGGSVSTNTAYGTSALAANTSGAYNTASGYQSLAANTSGYLNTAYGYRSLNAITTGAANVAVGTDALLVTTASSNTAVGHYVMVANTTGQYNVAIGQQSLYSNSTASNNTAVGYLTGYSGTTASNNTYLGQQAGYSNTTGQANVFLGRSAGYAFNVTGGTSTYNTFVGYAAGAGTTTGTANTFIGAGATGSSGEAVTTGSKNTILGPYTGNQGGLDIRTASNYIVLSDGDGNPRAYCSNAGAWSIYNSVSGGEVLLMQNSNATPYGMYMGFSAAAPNNSANYFLYCTDNAAQRITLRSNGGLANYQANNANLSDRREKTNFAPAKNYLDVICSIPVQTFNYIDQNLEEDDGLTLGVVAQDVQAVAPELVMESDWGTKEQPKMRLAIYQTDLQYALMKCIQEQQAIIETLTNRITALEAK